MKTCKDCILPKMINALGIMSAIGVILVNLI